MPNRAMRSGGQPVTSVPSQVMRPGPAARSPSACGSAWSCPCRFGRAVRAPCRPAARGSRRLRMRFAVIGVQVGDRGHVHFFHHHRGAARPGPAGLRAADIGARPAGPASPTTTHENQRARTTTVAGAGRQAGKHGYRAARSPACRATPIVLAARRAQSHLNALAQIRRLRRGSRGSPPARRWRSPRR